MVDKSAARKRRHLRVRNKISGTQDRPRLCVYRSLQHIYAQVINDVDGVTLVSASTLDPQLRDDIKSGGNKEAAKAVGALLAERCLSNGIEQVVFDRGGNLYHGRIKALADAAREQGLKF